MFHYWNSCFHNYRSVFLSSCPNSRDACNKEWIKKTKPALADTEANIAAYDTIYLVFPIWYYTAPLIVKSFLEAYDFSGKKIVIFATSGGSDLKKATQHIQAALPNAQVVEGAMLNGVSNFDEYIDY